MSFLVFGGETGWIGQMIVEILRSNGDEVKAAKSRLQYLSDIEKELDEFKPKYVINCAGLTGRPNVDWCEDHKEDTILVNVVGTVGLADACFRRGIHMTNFATGCIYAYDDEHTIGSSKGFTEDDPPNFEGSFYSKTKIIAEKLLRNYSNVLTLRLRMPISDDLSHRSFVTKIARYAKVVDIPNSMSILHDLVPIGIDMARRNRTGVYNFTNPGAISHNEILTMFKEIVCPKFEWSNFSLEEHDKVVIAKRSNNMLDVTKLHSEYPDLPEIHVAMRRCFERMREKLGEIEPPPKF